MKRIFVFLFISLVIFSSCSDMFDTDPSNIINSKDYISSEDEMYNGFLAIVAKVQQAGDKAIYLTDTRCDFLETTENAPVALKDICGYNETDGNTYADPSCYYSIVISCNDFISKMKEYRKKVGRSMDDNTETDFKALVSSAVRFKVWAYYTLGRIYGKAVWFNDPLESLKDIRDSATFTDLENVGLVVDSCIALLNNGVSVNDTMTVPANLEMDWLKWLDPEAENRGKYGKWNYIVPRYLLLKANLLSWRGTHADWLWIRNSILQYIDTIRSGTSDPDVEYPDRYYNCNIPLQGNYYRMFYTEEIGYSYQAVSSIMYDYDNQQRNDIVKYFCPVSSGEYYLKPSSYAIGKYSETDLRGITQRITMDVIGGDTCFTKYYYFRGSFLRPRIFEIMPAIPMQRGHDYMFLLAEAENHLGNWEQAKCILNDGVTNAYTYQSYIPDTWDDKQYFTTWFGDNGGYGDVGIVGCVRGSTYDLPKPTDDDYDISESERMKIYDEALASEYLREYTGEGKSYSYLIKMAERYHDPAIISDRVAPKYKAKAQQDYVRGVINGGGYWVNWTLFNK